MLLVEYPALTCRFGVLKRDDGRYAVVQIDDHSMIVLATYRNQHQARNVAQSRATMNRAFSK